MADTTQSEETHQSINPKQLVMLVRFKPGGSSAFDTATASSMLSNVTNPIDSAVGAIESAMENIPGLNMFIKEDPKQESTSEKKYTYYDDYSEWDSALSTIKDSLQELNPDNDIDTFEFSSADSEGRKKDAQQLFDKIKNKLSGWSKYTAWIHFIALDQGAAVANECTNLLAKDDKFKSEKWCVKSVVAVGAPLYKNELALNKESLKGQGALFSFGNLYDLTSAAIGYLEGTDKLLQLIADSNKNTLSLAVGKIKIRLTQILAIILSGLSFNLGPNALKDLDKFDQVKNEIKGMVDDILGFIKKLIDEGTSFVKLPDLPEFKKISEGYDAIPGKCTDKLEQFIEEIKNKAVQGLKAANLSLGPSDLSNALNCLCPVFDAISNSLGILKPDTQTGEDLAMQIIESAGITKVFAPSGDSTTYLPVDTEYLNKAIEAAKNNQPDMAGGLISKVKDLITKATEKTSVVKDMDKEHKIFLAEAISCMTLPMLPTKRDFYGKLVNALPFNINELTKDYTMGNLTGMAAGPLSGIGISFPDELSASIQKTDDEVNRIKGYFDQNNFKLMEKIDTLYLIYNAHNLILKKPHGEILKCIDQQTGYMTFMKAKGYDYTSDYKYVQATQEEKENAMPTQEVEKAA